MIDLLTPTLQAQLIENGQRCAASDDADQRAPLVKLFTPDGPATWLIVHLDPEDPDLAFGLCDLGVGLPELGEVRLSELQAVTGAFGLPVERDLAFKPSRTLAEYARLAAAEGRIRA